MLLLTNRLLDRNQQCFAASNELSQSLLYCEYRNGKTQELGSEAWMKALLRPEVEKILLYIHGFNNQPEADVIPNAEKMQKMLDQHHSKTVVVPIIWPCDNDFGIIKDYWDDQLAAELSGAIFSRAIGKLILWQQKHAPCYRKISVLAHSMGNRVLLHSLNTFAAEFGQQGVPLMFDEIYLMAADIPNNALEEGQPGRWLLQAANHVVCFYAKDDFAMPASKVMNLPHRSYTRRLGQTGPKHPIPQIEVMDCSSFNQKLDPPKGHTYFLDSDSPAWGRIKHRF
ncbi:alpha/beta hydrolase [Vibrio mytili]|uniref:alpha/beta hydrolase n=1 Tax=Vibrio mytili TaxID=50718 RepID=UPI002F427C63